MYLLPSEFVLCSPREWIADHLACLENQKGDEPTRRPLSSKIPDPDAPQNVEILWNTTSASKTPGSVGPSDQDKASGWSLSKALTILALGVWGYHGHSSLIIGRPLYANMINFSCCAVAAVSFGGAWNRRSTGKDLGPASLIGEWRSTRSLLRATLVFVISRIWSVGAPSAQATMLTSKSTPGLGIFNIRSLETVFLWSWRTWILQSLACMTNEDILVFEIPWSWSQRVNRPFKYMGRW